MSEQEYYKQKLIEKNQEFEDFVYIISHDVKAPLRAISNLSQWIEEDLGEDVTEEVQINLSLLKNRVKRMEMMMNALTEISRIKRTNLNIRELESRKAIEEIWEDLNVPATYQLELNGDFPAFQTLSQKLKTVLFHLIENAVKFQKRTDALVRVSCDELKTHFQFTVEDNGVGIDEKLTDKVFSIFFTMDSKEELNSIGAGLTLCKKILDFVGGEILLYSKENEGTKIVFTWPKEIDTKKNY
ncbi:MAG: ATP-binding protein [Marinifilaceae bacterium]